MKGLFSRFYKKTRTGGIWYLVFVFALGVALMLLAGYGNSAGKELKTSGEAEDTKLYLPSPQTVGASTSEYERGLEEKLEKTLSSVQGVGRVRVMLTVSTRDELTLAQDVTYESSAEPAENGRGAQSEKREQKHIILTDRDGHAAPVVTKRFEPKIEGAVIVAEGGGSAEIKASLTRAAEALLNLPAHKIEVLKMDGRK